METTMLSPDRIPVEPLHAAATDYDIVRRAIGFISEQWRKQPEVEQIAHAVGVTATDLAECSPATSAAPTRATPQPATTARAATRVRWLPRARRGRAITVTTCGAHRAPFVSTEPTAYAPDSAAGSRLRAMIRSAYEMASIASVAPPAATTSRGCTRPGACSGACGAVPRRRATCGRR